MSSEETAQQVRRAQVGDLEAFNWLVRRFQNRAAAYAATVLGSFHGGQDAAQEAFVEAYRLLPSLRAGGIPGLVQEDRLQGVCVGKASSCLFLDVQDEKRRELPLSIVPGLR